MHLYHIKQNGYIIGQARGKNKAVDFIKRRCIAREIRGTWETVAGNPRFHHFENGVEGHFTIEQNKGDL